MNINKKRLYFGRDLEAMSFANNYHKWILDEFKPYLGKIATEVGAGTGNFSNLLMRHVDRLILFEPSENMYPKLKKRFYENPGIETNNNELEQKHLKYSNLMDSIIYVNVLEHIEDEKKELSYIYKTLKHDGYALFFVPALSFLYSDFDKSIGHFRRYNKKSFIKLVQKAGFKINTIKYFDFLGIIPWYIFFVLLKRPMTGHKVALYDKLVVPFMQKIEKIITPPIGKNLIIVVSKI